MAAEIRRYFLDLNTSTRDLTLALGSEDRVTFHRLPQEEGWHITMVDTGLMTNKGSRIGRVSRYLEKAESFFVTYGDGVGDVDIDALLAFHRSHGRLATITGVQPRSQYGLVEADPTGQVAGFDEKPRLDHWINGGFMVFQRGVLDDLHGDDVDLERDTLSALAAAGELMMYRHPGYWRSMDTFKEAVELDAVWRERSPWKTW
jgi:glucose-1-phosphate cytidylyltransferase